VRRFGHFDAAEDATQEALLAAATRWPVDGVPDDPKAWLITVAARRLTDLLRSEQARRRREDADAARTPPDRRIVAGADHGIDLSADLRIDLSVDLGADTDDTLVLLFLCCHPALSPASQIALTLRAVGGLSTAEIARAFLVPEATMTRRITRAKQRIRDSGVPFGLPPAAERAQRTGAVLHVLYLVFNEGYAATSGPNLQRGELTAEAIRLARLVHRLLPDTDDRAGEAAGLLALVLLTDARRAARTGPDGALVPMAEQDRSRWDAAQIAEGVALLAEHLPRGGTGPYQLQAAIAAVHDEAPSAEETDWPQIVALYELLLRMSDNPVVALNHAVAVAMVRGPRAGLDLLGELAADVRVAEDHRLHAVRAHLLERAGEPAAARAAYLAAAARATSLPVQRHLHARAARLPAPGDGAF
jgi:RNA polymerase sigma factor (sigma-70 family)